MKRSLSFCTLLSATASTLLADQQCFKGDAVVDDDESLQAQTCNAVLFEEEEDGDDATASQQSIHTNRHDDHLRCVSPEESHTQADAQEAQTITTPAAGLEIERYDEYTWEEWELAGMRDHWEELGWTKIAWEEDELPPTWDRLWEELNDRERHAAEKLGFSEETWYEDEEDDEEFCDDDDDGEDCDENDDCDYECEEDDEDSECEDEDDYEYEYEYEYEDLENNGDILSEEVWPDFVEAVRDTLNFDYDTLSWDELESHGLDVFWEVLGWNKTIWQTDKVPSPIGSKSWDELTGEERLAAHSLGYIEPTWNGEEDWSDIALHVWDCYINHYDDYPWDELEAQELVEHWKVLGWTETRWDGDETPASWSKEWVELNKNERQAAEKLCFSADIWGKNVAELGM